MPAHRVSEAITKETREGGSVSAIPIESARTIPTYLLGDNLSLKATRSRGLRRRIVEGVVRIFYVLV